MRRLWVMIAISVLLLVFGPALAAAMWEPADISRPTLEERFDCLMEAEDDRTAEACVPGDQGYDDQVGLSDAGDKDGDGIDLCLLNASSPAEHEACVEAGSTP